MKERVTKKLTINKLTIANLSREAQKYVNGAFDGRIVKPLTISCRGDRGCTAPTKAEGTCREFLCGIIGKG